MFSLEEAKKRILIEILKYDAAAPAQLRPQIIDSATLERQFGWVFIYSNEASLATGQNQFRSAGPGPILFNRHTGEIRRFNATYEMERVAEDYEKELEAGIGCWVLFIGSSDTKQLALKLKNIFGMTGTEALKYAKRIPGPIFKGEWRPLSEFAPMLPDASVRVSSSKEKDLKELQSRGYDIWTII